MGGDVGGRVRGPGRFDPAGSGDCGGGGGGGSGGDQALRIARGLKVLCAASARGSEDVIAFANVLSPP